MKELYVWEHQAGWGFIGITSGIIFSPVCVLTLHFAQDPSIYSSLAGAWRALWLELIVAVFLGWLIGVTSAWIVYDATSQKSPATFRRGASGIARLSFIIIFMAASFYYFLTGSDQSAYPSVFWLTGLLGFFVSGRVGSTIASLLLQGAEDGARERISRKEEPPELTTWLAYSRSLLENAHGQLDTAPFADLDASLENRAEKYRRLHQAIPWGTVRGHESFCDVPRLIRALISIPPELAAVLILDTQSKNWRLTEMTMEALTSHPNELKRTEDQLIQQFGWQRGQLLEKIAAIVACVLCYKESPTKAKELLEDITHSELKRSIIEDMRRNHTEVCELV